VAKANNVDLELVVVDTGNPTTEYLAYNKLGKVPTFVGADGYVLTECIAIAIYSRSSIEEQAKPFLPYPANQAGAASTT
jgi:elongation factor 1-gamma